MIETSCGKFPDLAEAVEALAPKMRKQWQRCTRTGEGPWWGTHFGRQVLWFVWTGTRAGGYYRFLATRYRADGHTVIARIIETHNLSLEGGEQAWHYGPRRGP